ncbi:MAG: glutathione synthase [Burkholderiales bacterium]|nr:glutathione synthase [Burkholderiales bacterium]
MKKILFICDPLENLKVQYDNTYSLMLAANESNYEIHYCLPKDIYLTNNHVSCNCKKLSFHQNSYDIPDTTRIWYSETEYSTLNSSQFYAIMVRNDPPFNMEYYYLTQILHYAELCGSKVVNNSHALRNFNEKLSILNFPELIINTMVSKSPSAINTFISQHKDCIIKPLDLMGGRGVFKISPTEINYGAIIETSTNYYTQTVMLQKFIPEVVHGDKRIFVVNGEVIEYCLYRIPQINQIRGNIAAGGRGEVKKITEKDLKLANIVAKWLKHKNIVFAGLDVIGDYLTEINITSPTGTRQIHSKTRINIPKLVIEAL